MTTINIKRFPADLWHKVRVAAAQRGVTIRAFVVEALVAHLAVVGSRGEGSHVPVESVRGLYQEGA